MAVSVQNQLLKIIEIVDHSGQFHSTGELPPTHPGMIIEGIGLVGLPLDKRQATALKKKAKQAPYGKGDLTIVDTTVRRVWEIDAADILFGNSQWKNVLNEALKKTQTELGLKDQKLEAHFYKLLIYEKGSFFLPHRDGEKLDRMVATLVVVLPSAHSGGELVIRHDQKEVVVDFSAKSSFDTQFAAFFADCEHEVRPVTSGVRLALVYNLTLEKQAKPIKAPTIGEQIAQSAQVLGQWKQSLLADSASSAPADPLKLAVLLDHQYTQAGLCLDILKGADRGRADTLFAAAKMAGCDASLALVTYWVSGSAEPGNDYGRGYGYRRNQRYGWNDDFDDDEQGEHEMDEVFESSLNAEHFTDSEGRTLFYGQIPVKEIEIVSKKPISDGKPDQEDYEGYTGNAGMTLERWYHRAAILVWPAEHRFDRLCQGGTENAVGGLEFMIQEWSNAPKSKKADLHRSCLKFANRIIANWPEQKYAGHYSFGFDLNNKVKPPEVPGESGAIQKTVKTASSLLLAKLEELNDIALISQWIEGVLAKDMRVNPGKAFSRLLNKYGWATFQNELQGLFAKTGLESLERHAWLLADWALMTDKNADRRMICTELASRFMECLLRDPTEAPKIDYRARDLNRLELLPPITLALLAINKSPLLGELVTFILGNPKDYDLVKVQVPALMSLENWLKVNVKKPAEPLGQWIRSVVTNLELRKSNRPVDPPDWKRKSVTGCDCADCKLLSGFLEDPNTKTLHIKLAEKRRMHLHQIIDRKQLDTTHVTERQGSPFTLVCTKTNSSYELAMKFYKQDLVYQARIQQIMDWHEAL